jgi:hypothetical protein
MVTKATEKKHRNAARLKAIREILNGISGYPYYLSNVELVPRDPRAFIIEVEGRDISYDILEAIATSFGTKNINFNPETRHGGGCESCAYDYSVVVIHVADITKGVENNDHE